MKEKEFIERIRKLDKEFDPDGCYVDYAEEVSYLIGELDKENNQTNT
tara:strand:- start:20493 stop:20633 length:141 start_codon:yes stop_codon:yes gene_type:complete